MDLFLPIAIALATGAVVGYLIGEARGFGTATRMAISSFKKSKEAYDELLVRAVEYQTAYEMYHSYFESLYEPDAPPPEPKRKSDHLKVVKLKKDPENDGN